LQKYEWHDKCSKCDRAKIKISGRIKIICVTTDLGGEGNFPQFLFFPSPHLN